jgi:pimeloyl-ACP methyl ester carboxylesterase
VGDDQQVASIYRSPGDERTVRAWCQQRLAGRRQSTLGTTLGETALVTVGGGTRTVVFLPGTTFNAATSLTVLDACAAAGFRAICADLPGQPGLSSAVQPPEDAAYAGWVGEVLRHVRAQGPNEVRLVGHSRGAAVALSADPELVDGVVVASPAGLLDVRPTWAILRATVPWMVRRSDGGSRGLVELMAGPGRYPEELVPWLTLAVRSSHPTGAPKRLPDDVLHRWRGHPVAVLVGSHDCFFPASRITELARADLGVTATVVPGAGHLLIDQAPEAVVRALVGL